MLSEIVCIFVEDVKGKKLTCYHRRHYFPFFFAFSLGHVLHAFLSGHGRVFDCFKRKKYGKYF